MRSRGREATCVPARAVAAAAAAISLTLTILTTRRSRSAAISRSRSRTVSRRALRGCVPTTTTAIRRSARRRTVSTVTVRHWVKGFVRSVG